MLGYKRGKVLKIKILRVMYIILGSLSVIIGAAARLAPGVPTTPFLLLALFCFNKSSERLSARLKNTFLYKKYLAEYVQKRSMTLKQKLSIQIFASIMMAISFVSVQNLVFRVVLVALFIAHHYVFLFRIKTYKPDITQSER